MRRFRRRRRLWRDKAGGGVPPAFLFAVALAHPVVYSHFRILQGKKRKLHKKVWKKMRGCRGRRKNFPQKFFSSPPAINQSFPFPQVPPAYRKQNIPDTHLTAQNQFLSEKR